MFPFIPLFFPLLLLQALKKSTVTEADLKCVEKKKKTWYLLQYLYFFIHIEAKFLIYWYLALSDSKISQLC